jgi:hypothetical protein
MKANNPLSTVPVRQGSARALLKIFSMNPRAIEALHG